MNNTNRFVCLSFIVLIFGSTIIAQDTCSELVQTAIETASDNCSDLRRNEACYGNVIVDAEASPNVVDFTFEDAGDIASINDLASMRLLSQVEETGEWGISLMQVGLITDDGPDNAQFVLFGDVEVTNDVEPVPELVTIEVTTTGNINLRGGPSTNHSIVGSTSNGQTVTANGRLEDGSWYRLQLEDDSIAWIFAQLVTSEEDPDTLAVAAADDVPNIQVFGPMQAFIVETGIDDAPCEEAPESGVLIQTPEGIGEIVIKVNEVEIRFDSTTYIQSQPSGDLYANILEGRARITAVGETVYAPAGSRVRVPMDANSHASGPPSDPEPYDDADMALVLTSLLNRQIAVAPSLDQTEIETLLANLLPESGVWDIFWTGNAADANLPFFCVSGYVTSWSEDLGITYAVNGDMAFVWSGSGEFGDLIDFTLSPVEENVYADDARRLVIEGPGRFTLEFTGQCSVFIDFTQ